MGVGVRIIAAILFINAAAAIAQSERCSYMTAIPRQPKPENLPEQDFDGLPWNEQPLVEAEDREDVCMAEYLPLASNLAMQIIYMDEKREGDVAIAKLNYNGAAEPFVEPTTNFQTGTISNLGLQIRQGADGSWYLYTTVSQDFEAGMIQYVFNVRVPTETLVVAVSLVIVDIGVNPPNADILEACRILVREDDSLCASDHATTAPTTKLVELLDENNTSPTLQAVREADPRPIFLSDLYTAGISTLDAINKELLTVQARHTDGLPITYSINATSMVADPTLEAVRDSAFALHPDTGVLTLTMQPTDSMHGMFDFKVVATDADGVTDSTDVRIYLISSLNRVTFIFINTLEQVEEGVSFIAATFSTGFEMTCNIDQVVPASDAQGVALDDNTEVRAHFIRDNQPVLNDEIEQLRSDTVRLKQIQNVLSTDLLVLKDFYSKISPNDIITDRMRNKDLILALIGLLAGIFLGLMAAFLIIGPEELYFLRRRNDVAPSSDSEQNKIK